MNLYTVTFQGHHRMHQACLSKEDVLALTNVLENAEMRFKVSNGASYVTQENMGCGGYLYWLRTEDNF